MAVTYFLTGTSSDLSAGGLFNFVLVDVNPDSGGFQNTGNFQNSTVSGYAFTETGKPGVGGQTGTITVEMEILIANSNINVFTRLARVDSSGAVQIESSAASPQSAGTAGVKTFTFTDVNLGTWQAGDRLRVQYSFQTASTMNQSTRLGYGTANNEVATPFDASGQQVDIDGAAGTAGAASGSLSTTSGGSEAVYSDTYSDTYTAFSPGSVELDGVAAAAAHVESDADIVPPRPAVTGLSATATSESDIFLQWDAFPDAVEYEIERDGTVVVTDNVDTDYIDSGLDPDTEYTYRVRAALVIP